MWLFDGHHGRHQNFYQDFGLAHHDLLGMSRKCMHKCIIVNVESLCSKHRSSTGAIVSIDPLFKSCLRHQ